MTRRKAQAEDLRKIAQIRLLQREAAEAEVARAHAALAQKNEVFQHSRDERDLAEAGWAQTVTTDTICLETMPLWTQIVAMRDARTRQDAEAVQGACSARDDSIACFHMAEQRSSVAEEMAQKALRARLQELEEAAMQDAADRHLRDRSRR